MNPERKLLLQRAIVICGVGAAILWGMAHPPDLSKLAAAVSEPVSKSKQAEAGSGWYATIYCNNRMPSCGVRDGYVVEIPQRVMAVDLGTPRDRCETYATLLAKAADERAMVTVNCSSPAGQSRR